MGIVNQPKPTEPHSPVPDVHPLQPGVVHSETNIESATRIRSEAPEDLRHESENIGELEHAEHERHKDDE
jgi:hypothetical protein